jgi:hypothetical protein
MWLTVLAFNGLRAIEKGTQRCFPQTLAVLWPNDNSKWLIVEDFNLIYFHSALAFCSLKEINLESRKFTWSNKRRRPPLIQINRFFYNALHALSSSHSDHCPLILARQSRPFKFENFWTRLPRFQETVQQAWNLLMPPH